MREGNNDKDASCPDLLMDGVARLISRHQATILNDWVSEVIREVPGAQGKSRTELGDHLKTLLDDVIAALDLAGRRPTISEESIFFNEERQSSNYLHGRERASMRGYTVDHVVHEYIILRRHLNRFCRQHGIADPAVIDIISLVIDAGSLSSVREFNRSTRAIQQKLVGTLVHDVRTPLGVAHNLAQLMSRLQMDNGSTSEAIDTITRNLHRAGVMLEELLDSVRSDATEGLFMRFEKGDLSAALRTACKEADQLYGDRRISGQYPPHPVTGVFDLALIVRTVENLISNAVKFGECQSTVEVTLEDLQEQVRICVHSNSPPIPAKNLEQIFEFFSSFPKYGQPVKSWGLGLALIKTIVDSHGGEIIIESSKEQGTTVGMTLGKHFQQDGSEISVLI